MSVCWHCAFEYDQRVTMSPLHYCSTYCYGMGSKPYNKAPVLNPTAKIHAFATKLIDKLHYLQHGNHLREYCNWDLCVEAKILGL